MAVVYPNLMHYREPIFQLLSRQEPPEPTYTIFTAPRSHAPSVKTADVRLAAKPVSDGGIRWRFIRNFYLGDTVLQSGMIRLALSGAFDTIIYLGDPHFLTTWIGILLARLTGKRVLLWTHGFLREQASLTDRIRLVFFRLAHGLLLYGNRSARIGRARGLDAERLYVIFNSLDYDNQVRIRGEIGPEDRKRTSAGLFGHPEWPILIATCRLIRKKRLEMILESVRALKDEGKHVNALLVGDGPERAELQARARSLEIADRVAFYGACYDEQTLGRLFSAATLCVMPGEVGLTAMHSLSYGTPVITHDRADLQMPEYEAIVPGKTGDLFQHGSVKDLTATISRWLARGDHRDQTRAACHEIVDRLYNPDFQRRVMNEAVNGTPASRCPTGRTAVDPLFS